MKLARHVPNAHPEAVWGAHSVREFGYQDSTCRQVWKRWAGMRNLQGKPYLPSVGQVRGVRPVVRSVGQTSVGGGSTARAPLCSVVPSAASGVARTNIVEQSAGMLVVGGKSTIELGVSRALLGEGCVREGIESALSAAFTRGVEHGRTCLGGSCRTCAGSARGSGHSWTVPPLADRSSSPPTVFDMDCF